MKEFLLLFRQADFSYRDLSAEDFQALTKKWHDWAGGIAAEGKLGNTGSRLAQEGKVLKPGGVITDGPFVEIRERLGGFLVVKSDTLEEATTLAHGCPVLEVGGSVEIREIVS
ncbi:YciI family protein [Chitinophaga sp.]|uniref:YciI family protein n=1 Tax=Chitinophaga sp. TaxID=1869181 RepID=UPI002F93CFF9